MDLTKVVFSIIGNASSYLNMCNQVVNATKNMANQVIGHVNRMSSSLGNFGSGANWGGGGGFRGFTSSVIRGTLHGGVAGMTAAVMLGPVLLAANVVSSAIDRITSSTWDAVKATIQLGMEYEKVRTTFEVLSGSRSAGRELFGNVQQLAIQTPYTAKQLTTQGQTLLGYGTAPEQLVPTLARIGDLAAGDENRLRKLSLAYGQVLSHGRFMGQELRQFAEAGVGAADFAKTLGVTGTEFRAMVQAGQVGADTMIKTINRLTSEGGRFYGMNREQLKTVGGAWNSLVETVEVYLGKVGAGVFERLNIAQGIQNIVSSMGDMNKLAEQTVNWFERFGSGLKPIVDDLTIARRMFSEMLSGTGSMTAEEFGQKIAGGIKEAAIVTLEFAEGLKLAYVRIQMIKESLSNADPLGLRGTWYDRQMNRLWNAMPGDPVAEKIMGTQGKAGSITGNRYSEEGWELGLPENHPLRVQQREIIKRQNAIRGNFETRLNAIINPTIWTRLQRMNAGMYQGSPEINVPYSPSPAALDIIRGISQSSTHGGISALDQFGYRMGGIEEAVYGPPGVRQARQIAPVLGQMIQSAVDQNRFGNITGIQREFATVRGGIESSGDAGKMHQLTIAQRQFNAVMGGVIPQDAQVGSLLSAFISGAFQPAISESQGKIATFQAYQQLAHAVGNQIEMKLPPALARGSSEAQDTINRSMIQQTSVQEEIREILREANRLHTEQRTYMEAVWNEIQLQRSQGTFIIPGTR